MGFDKFMNYYAELSKPYQKIVFEFFRRLEHDGQHQGLNGIDEIKRDISKNIQKYRKEKGYTIKSLLNYMEEKTGFKPSEDTLWSIIRRNTQNSTYNDDIAKALDITKRQLYYGDTLPEEFLENFAIMCADAYNLKWLFESLTEKNQNAVLYLVHALDMVKIAPEIFEDELEDELV